jgi:hypothetical protein
MVEVEAELSHSLAILKEKIADEVRHMAWVKAVMYTPERQADLLLVIK